MLYTLVINTTQPIYFTGIIFQGAEGTSLLPLSGEPTSGTFTPTNGKVSLSYDITGEVHFVRFIQPQNATFTINFYGGLFSVFNVQPQLLYSNGQFEQYVKIGNEKAVYADVPTVSSTKRSSHWTTAVYTSGSVEENSTIRFKFLDTSSKSWVNWRVVGSSAYQNDTHVPYTSFNLTKSMIKLRERSSLANLYASQAPVITSIEVFAYSATLDKVVVRADKAAQVVIYVMNLDTNLTETAALAFARDADSVNKEHIFYIPTVLGNKRIVAIPTIESFYKDFNNVNALGALNSYNYSKAELIVSRYQEGYEKGRLDAYKEIYALGTPYGYSFNFNERSDYGTSSENTLFISTLADAQYAKGLKEVYDRGAAYGFTYNTSTIDRNYLLNQQVPFINKLTSSGAIETYQALYSKGLPYGFNYDSTQTSKTYYQNKEDEYIAKIDSHSRSAGYKLAYSELFTTGRAYQGVAGLPLGGSLWVDDTSTNNNFASKKEEFIRHIYNSGYVKAKQETFDRGLPFGFDFRNYINVNNKIISEQSLLGDYRNVGSEFIDVVTARAKASGYLDIYDYIANQYGFNYNSTNSTNLSANEYTTYLSGIKVSALSKVSDVARIGAYNDVYGEISNNFLFTYNNSRTDVVYYSNLKNEALKQVYNYGSRAAYQDIYEQGGPYHFNTLTSYGVYRNSNYSLKPAMNDATTSYFHSISQTYTEAVRDYGAISTFKRFFNLASTYGFLFDSNQKVISYYDGKVEEFLSIYSSANFSEGVNYVMNSAFFRYGFQYTFSSDENAMKAQVIPLFDYIDNVNKSDSYRFALEALGSESFYNIAFVDSSNHLTLKAQVVPKLQELKDKAGVEAYNYVMTTANTRTGYSKPNLTSSAALKAQISNMFKYVEDYKEADAYRRVHNYAKNFLNVGYTFTDSTDPRFLENQVPGLFDFLGKFGGYGAYKYVHETAGTMFGWNFIDSGNEGDLKSQIVPMFEFINSSFQDVKVISEPRFEWPDKLVFDVELTREAGVYAILVDKLTNDHIAGFSSMESKLKHAVKFGVGVRALNKPVGIVIIPTPRNMNIV